MKPFFAAAYIVVILCCGLNIEMTLSDGTIQHANMVANNDVYLAGYTDTFHSTASKETNGGGVQGFSTSGHKLPAWGFSAKKYAVLIKANKNANYLRLSANHISRLEGPDIIRPFNYFW